MNNLIGKTLGQYEIREKVGEGGMAYVFKAYHATLDRFVAIKILSPILSSEPGFTERFQREARAVARLNHPNILPVYDFGRQDNYNYIVMRYVEDSLTLNTLMQQKAPIDELINYIIQVADALNYAHERGIIHRDVKPGNILIDGRWALLSDFGLVKDRTSSSELTHTGTGMGTPAYMSPEQARGIHVDQRTDIYSLGVILHKILTGAVPHDANTPLGIILKRTTEPVSPLRQTNPDISQSLDYVTLRALAREPDRRYSTAGQFAEALKKAKDDPLYQGDATDPSAIDTDATIASGLRVSAEVTSAPDSLPTTPSLPTMPPLPTTPRSRNLSLIIGGGVAAAVVIGVLIFALLFLRRGDTGSASNGEVPSSLPGTETIPIANLAPAIPWLPFDENAVPGVECYSFNVNLPPFDNPLVRQAFASAVDREAIVRMSTDLLGLELSPATTFTPPDVLGRDLYGQVGLPFDVDRARELLAQAGYPNGEGFPQVTLAYISTGHLDPEVKAVAAMWRDHLGIEVELQPVDDEKAYTELLESDTIHIFRVGWIGDYVDPDNFLNTTFRLNISWAHHFNNSIFNDIVEQAEAKAANPALRQQLYIRAERILCEQEAAIIPLYHYHIPSDFVVK
jgi:serine/threonine protein kinase